MAKKRIHELAKEYGLSGKELAAKLRARGFSQVKSHMTALDEFELLQVQAVLEVDGIVPATKSEDESEALGGVIVRKKKKKRVEEGEPVPETAVDAAAPIVVEPGDEVLPMEEPTAEGAPEPVATEAQAPAPVEPETEVPLVEELSVEAPEGAGAEPTEPLVAAAEVELEAEAEPAEEAPVEIESPAEALAVEELVEEPVAEIEEVAELEMLEELEVLEEIVEAEPEEEAGGEAAKPDKKKSPRRQGKVVGFIDLSKIQTTTQRKSESRRLGSGDDVMPDVRPTLRHDPRRAMMRGDRGSRDRLSAAQLREREAGRYLRRSGRGAAGATKGPRGPRGSSLSGSPYSGGTVKIESPMTVKKLAEAMAVKANQVLREAFRQLGFGAININSILDEETAQLLAGEFQIELDVVHEVEAEEALIEELKKKRSAFDEEELASRNPTVAFLGHVDHGKTTLIDFIRETQVAEGESGGITQHIGAYQITTKSGNRLTIIDTPGHAAFTRMRARGARAVDVVVLVVAADAGVQPQTGEALNHARAASSPIVVALTKVDRPEANAQRVMQQLAGLGLSPEAWGGETGMVEVSGITGQGVQELLERVALESELLELQCHPDSPAEGVVLEAEVQQGKGIVAHLLIQDGTLKRGDVILAGEGYGKVRSIQDDRGETIAEAGPSTPVEVTGLSALPGIGEPFHVVDKLDDAKEVAGERARKNRAADLVEKGKLGGRDLLELTGPTKEIVNFIIRADVQGSVEVLSQALGDLAHEEVGSRVLQAGVGAVTENDILLASTSDALVVAFRVGVGGQARQAADREGVEIRNYNVLYDVLDDARDMLEGRLAPDIQEEVTGHAEIRRVFKSSKFGTIAGCFVLDGTITRDNGVRLLRDGTVVYTGTMTSIRREKDDVREIREGFECGILLRNYNDLREGDVIEAYRHIEVKRTFGQPTTEG